MFNLRRHIIFVFVLFLASLGFIHGQITVNQNENLESIVQGLAGVGVKISNITYDCEYNGQNPPYGKFVDAGSQSGLSRGLLLTTGAARNAVGPNNESGISTENSMQQKFDDDLENLLNNTSEGVLFDLCMVEFDISVYADTLSFQYVFASDEYPEFVGSFYDLFGFFISGPGISGTKNIAVVPGTTQPVSIGTINYMNNSQYYTPNGNGQSQPYSEIMQYDAFTTVLTAKTVVIPCETYHIKLAIADEADGSFDSGVFLEAESFTTSSVKISSRLEYEKFNNAIEGCNKGYVKINRLGHESTDLSLPLVVKYDIIGSAINGVDYDFLADSVIIRANEESVEFEVNPINDLILEPLEYIEFLITNDCPALPPTFNTRINIVEEFEYKMAAQSVCQNDSIQLNFPDLISPYAVSWMPPKVLNCTNCQSPWVNSLSSTYLKYNIVDPISNCEANDSLLLNVEPIPIVSFTYTGDLNYTNLDIFFSNHSQNADTYKWDFDDDSTSTELSPFHTFPEVSHGEPISYEVVLTGTNSTNGCTSSHSEIINFAEPFFIPNIITPNGDLNNEYFDIKGISSHTWSLKIYNRWGKNVFQSEGYDKQWSASNLPDGTYFYLLTNPLENRKYKGFVNVLR